MFLRLSFLFIFVSHLLFLLLFQGCGGSSPTKFQLKKQEYVDLMTQANQMSRAGDHAVAIRFYQDACQRLALLDDLSTLIECRLNLAATYIRMGNDSETQKQFEQAAAIAEDFSLRQDMGKVYVQTALYWIKKGNLDQAQKNIDQSIAAFLAAYQQGYTDKEPLYKAYAYKGYLLRQEKKYKQAMVFLEKAEASKNSQTKSYTWYNMAYIYLQQQAYQDAEKILTRAIELDKKGVYPRYLVYDYILLAKIYLAQGNRQKSIFYAKRALLIANNLADSVAAAKATQVLKDGQKELVSK